MNNIGIWNRIYHYLAKFECSTVHLNIQRWRKNAFVRPDSYLSLWHHLNHLLTYLTENILSTTDGKHLCRLRRVP